MNTLHMRISLRLMILFIAIVAIFCWIDVRRRNFLALVDYHESRMPSPNYPIEGNERGIIAFDIHNRKLSGWEIAWHRLLAEKYRRASRTPWRYVEPDPSQDEFRIAYHAWYKAHGNRILHQPKEGGHFHQWFEAP